VVQPSIAGFPTTDNGFPDDAFVTKLSPSGSNLVYSTFLGGSGFDRAGAIAVDLLGNAYIVGRTGSADFPVLHPLQTSSFSGSDISIPRTDTDAFLSKLNPSGSKLMYSTYLGGSSRDSANGVAVDGFGNASVVGSTSSADFPVLNAFNSAYVGGCDPLQEILNAGCDGFVLKVNAAGSRFLYSSYLHGTGSAVAMDLFGNTYATGNTFYSDLPIKNAFQPTLAGQSDAFVTKLNPAGKLLYSTYLGGSGTDVGTGIAVDLLSGNAYVCGNTASSDFPTANALQTTNGGGAFVTQLNPAGRLVFSTFLGGNNDGAAAIAVDLIGNAYVIGFTNTAASDVVVTKVR
jgi:hypothetical protein